ncbi:hypothetical protein I9W82_003346 [Candida metapsilosis]|uniref:Uncharacterized protein n=1 Tax=Candida metapsilosis TaxID=273372 RepID=A0A8H7ZD05_9ASCO|nr:hypothetical protein I9W82_003346 [Candida metapsilosis]
MHLFDLPVHILGKIIPVEEYVLKLPTYIGIRLINNLPAWNRIDFITHWLSQENNERVEFLRKYPSIFMSMSIRKLNLRYMTSTSSLNLNAFAIGSKPVGFMHLKFWTGNVENSQYLWLPSIAFGPIESVEKRQASFEMPDKVIITRHHRQQLNSLNQNQFLIDARDNLLRGLQEINLYLTVGKYLDLAETTLRNKNLKPTRLQIFLRFTPQQRNHNEVETTGPYPTAFPLKWITDYFDTSNLDTFTLHYFAPTTTIEYSDDLFKMLMRVSCVDVAVGKLDITKLPLVPSSGRARYQIQIKVARGCYNLIKDRCNKGSWKVFTDKYSATFVNCDKTQLWYLSTL